LEDPKTQDVQALLALAQDKSKATRSMMVTAFAELFSDEKRLLTDKDRSTMSDIVHQLIKQVEEPVRRAVAERLSKAPDVPRDLVLDLANDTIDVAYPILINSEALRDDELIEIVQYRTMEHQVAIARRPNIGKRVSEVLIWTKNEEVISNLLENDTAQISEESLGEVVDAARTVESFRQPLVNRKDLSPQLAEKLYWSVSAALREHIAERFDVDLTTLDDAIEGATVDVLRGDLGRGINVTSPLPLDTDVSDSDVESLLYLVRQAQILDFVSRFSALANLRAPLIRRLLFETGGEGLAIACKAVGIPQWAFIEMFIFFRQGRLGEKIVENDEVPNAMAFYEKLAKEDALATINRWRRNEGYLNALRLVKGEKDTHRKN